MSIKSSSFLLFALLTTTSGAQTITVAELLDPASAPAGSWTFDRIVGGGTAAVVDLSGEGSTLQQNQSGSGGALRLSTGFDNDDEAAAVLNNNFGDAATVLADLTIGYSYFKQSVDGGNIYAAPALRIGVSASGGTGDNYGELVYEPYWNQPGGGAPAVPADTWQTVTITSSTGGGNPANSNANGGWWWSGGFEVDNSYGGPPLRSLDEWVDVFMAADPLDFGNAQVVSIALAVGTYNQGQMGYVDTLSFSAPGLDATSYQFSAVPEPSTTVLVCGVAVLFLTASRRLRKRR